MSIVNIVKEPEYYYPAGMAEQDGLMTYQEFQKLDNIPTPSNIVTKSSTAGLLKNDGTVDSNSYVKKSDLEEIKTASGNPITLTDAVSGNALEVSAEIVASQDLHGYDKPWVGGAGANKWDEQWEQGRLNTDGTEAAATDCIRSKNYIPVLPNTSYYFYIGANTNGRVCYYNQNKQFVYTITGANEIKTTPADCYFLRFSTATEYGGTYNNDIAVNYPSSVTTYSPYENVCPITGFSTITITDVDSESHTATVTVALGQTVYGGTLDLTSGELTITHANIASYNGETIGEPWISSMDEYSQGRTPTTGAQVVYTLATPTTTTLTAAQLALVKGYNHLTCNSGDMEITYKASGLDALKERVEELEDRVDDLTVSDLADTAITTPTNGQVLGYNSTSGKWENQNPSGGVAESVVGPVENSTTASQPYAVGEHFIRNDKFCTVIATIASGATLTQGTNYVEGTIAEAIARQGTYSTDEIEIGTWLGKRLYRRTFDVGSLTLYSGSWNQSNIPSTDKTALISVLGMNSTGTYFCLHGSCDGANYCAFMVTRSDGQAASVNYITLEYTKS